MAYVKLTNTTENERRAIYTSEGYVTVEPGQSRVLDVSDADLEANKQYFKHEKAKQSDATDEQPLLENDRINPAPDIEIAPQDAYSALSDDALRDAVEEKTGERPHHKTGRDKLLATLRAD